jgi:hypothetical protein
MPDYMVTQVKVWILNPVFRIKVMRAYLLYLHVSIYKNKCQHTLQKFYSVHPTLVTGWNVCTKSQEI